MKKLACGWYLSLGFSFVFFEGCMSAQNHGALQEIENAMQSAQKSQGMEEGPVRLMPIRRRPQSSKRRSSI